MNTFENAIDEANLLEHILRENREEYRKLPNGRLECHKRDYGWRWFLIKGEERRCLKHNDEVNLARKLAYKRLLKTKIDMDSAKLKALKQYLDSANPEKLLQGIDKRARENSEINRLAKEYKNKHDLKIEEWMGNVQPDENFRKDELTVESKSGQMVRSKSEALIYGTLCDHGLHFVYEPRLELKEMFVDSYTKIIHPDFGIWSDKLNGPIYWEHLGLLDNVNYLRTNAEKLSLYMYNGFVPMKNLIITSEYTGKDFDAHQVEKIIDYFF